MTQQWEDDETWEEVTPDTPEQAVTGTQTQAVVNDRYDNADWQDALTQPDLHDMHQGIDVLYEGGSELLRDLFWLFTKGAPQIRDTAEMAPEHIAQRQLVDKFQQHPEVANLRAHTVAQPFNAVTAMLSMDTEIRAALDALLAAQQQAKDLAQAIEDGLPQAEVDALRASTEAAGMAAAIGASGPLVAGAEQVEAQITEDGEIAAGFGVGGGDMQQMGHGERTALMKRLRGSRIAKFAKLIGQFRAEAQAQMRKQADDDPSEITDVELGDDLSRLTSTELANLAIPELEMDFLQRYTERALLVYKVTGNNRKGRGPIVLCVDESGSMVHDQVGGVTREAWSKALSLAMVDLARKQRRGVVYIGWSTRSDGKGGHEPCTVTIDLSKNDLDSTIEMTEHFFNGGTHYERPLEEALKIATDHFDTKSEGRADIVFITDDVYGKNKLDPFWVQQFNDERKRVSVGVHGILIGSAQSGAMAQVCDTVRPITGVIAGNEIEPVAGMFQELMKP